MTQQATQSFSLDVERLVLARVGESRGLPAALRIASSVCLQSDGTFGEGRSTRPDGGD